MGGLDLNAAREEGCTAFTLVFILREEDHQHGVSSSTEGAKPDQSFRVRQSDRSGAMDWMIA